MNARRTWVIPEANMTQRLTRQTRFPTNIDATKNRKEVLFYSERTRPVSYDPSTTLLAFQCLFCDFGTAEELKTKR